VKVKNEPLEKIGGWKCTSQKTVYDNPWINVSHQEVLRPNGSEGIYGVVHFKSRALGVVAIDADGMIIFVKQSRYTLNEYTYEIPEGGGPFDEDPLDAIKRELEEETGFCARSWQKILTMHTSNSVTDETGYLYLAEDLYSGQQMLEDSEDIEVLRFSMEQALEMIDDGSITDSLTIAGILKVALMRR